MTNIIRDTYEYHYASPQSSIWFHWIIFPQHFFLFGKSFVPFMRACVWWCALVCRVGVNIVIVLPRLRFFRAQRKYYFSGYFPHWNRCCCCCCCGCAEYARNELVENCEKGGGREGHLLLLLDRFAFWFCAPARIIRRKKEEFLLNIIRHWDEKETCGEDGFNDDDHIECSVTTMPVHWRMADNWENMLISSGFTDDATHSRNKS